MIMFLSNLIFNFFLIPRLGIVGAGFARLFTILIGFSILFYSANQIIEFSSLQIIKKIIPIGLSFSILLYLIQNWNLFLVILISVIVYIGLTFSFNFFSKHEKQIMKELFIKIRFHSK